MRGTGGFEGVLDELREPFSLHDGFEVDANLDAAGEGRVRDALQGLGETRMTDQPQGQQITTVEGEVQERREVAKELGRQIVRFVQDPEWQDLLGIGQLEDARFEFAPELRPAERRRDAEREGEASIQIEAPEIGLGQVNDLILMRVEVLRQGTQQAGLADAGFADNIESFRCCRI
jgi:hypothetical protein